MPRASSTDRVPPQFLHGEKRVRRDVRLVTNLAVKNEGIILFAKSANDSAVLSTDRINSPIKARTRSPRIKQSQRQILANRFTRRETPFCFLIRRSLALLLYAGKIPFYVGYDFTSRSPFTWRFRRRSTDWQFLIRCRRRRPNDRSWLVSRGHLARIEAESAMPCSPSPPTSPAPDRPRTVSRGASGPTTSESVSRERTPILTAPRDSDSARFRAELSRAVERALGTIRRSGVREMLLPRRYSWSSTSTGRRASFRARNRGQRGLSGGVRCFGRYSHDRSIFTCPGFACQ